MYGEKLKDRRIENNLSQSELAKNTGITQEAISLWEKNKRQPNIIYCVKLADFYGISLDELIDRKI